MSKGTLPPGWAWAAMEEMIEFVTSGSRGWARHYAEHGALFLRIGNLGRGTVALDLSKIQRVNPPEGAEALRTRVCAGDLLISITADLGMTAVVPEGIGEAFINQHIALTRLVGPVSRPYVAWFLASQGGQDQLIGLQRGATKLGLGLDDIRAVRLPLPPLAEQERIVAAIEGQLSRLDAAVAGLERVRAGLKRYRAAVLKAACVGRLVPTEAELARAAGRGYEPADVLLARIMAERRGRSAEPAPPNASALPELPEGWCWTTAAGVGDIQLGRQRSPRNRSAEYATKYVRAANLTWKGLDLNDVLEMDFKPHELPTYQLTVGDILLSEASGSADQVGKPAVWRGQIATCCFQNTVIRCRPRGMPPDYLYALFLHYALNGRFAARSRGVGIHHLGAEGLATTPVPLPPLAEQERIVAEVERRLSVVEELEATVEAGLRRAARLRQAILKRAFEGKLVPQDPNDEPASVLLERIRAERAQAAEGRANRRAVRGRRGGRLVRQLGLDLSSDTAASS